MTRSVAEVTGPIEARITPTSEGGRRLFEVLRKPNKPAKFFTVDELVNVMTSGRRAGFFRAALNRVREACGTTVS